MSRCYQCDRGVGYLFTDGRCWQCTRMTREEVEGTIAPDAGSSAPSGEDCPPEWRGLTHQNEVSG